MASSPGHGPRRALPRERRARPPPPLGERLLHVGAGAGAGAGIGVGVRRVFKEETAGASGAGPALSRAPLCAGRVLLPRGEGSLSGGGAASTFLADELWLWFPLGGSFLIGETGGWTGRRWFRDSGSEDPVSGQGSVLVPGGGLQS